MANLITHLNAEELIQILASHDEDFNEDDFEIAQADEDDGEDVLLFNVDEESKICFNFLDDNDLIVMTYPVANLEEIGQDLSLVNAFNEEAVNSAAYVDEEGDIILRSSLCLRGGVSEDNICEFFSNFFDDLETLGNMFDGDDSEEE